MFQQTPQIRVHFKRTLRTLVLGVLSIATILYGGFAFRTQPALAATSQTVNFQARLKAINGSIAPDGYYNVQFKLYSVSSAGTALWTESYYDLNGATAGSDNRTRVANGYISVALGSQTPFPSTINWDQDLYLTMNVGGMTQTATPTYDGEMNPRLKMTGVPYAFKAGALAQFNNTTGFTSTLELLQPTGGNQSFRVADQTAAGTYTLCVQGASTANGGCAAATGASGYIQNQNASAQSTSNLWISGTARSDTSIVAPLFDAASSGVLNVGTSTATTINIGKTTQAVVFPGAIYVNGATTAGNVKLAITGSLDSTSTGTQYGLQNQVDFTPQGASASSIIGSANLANVVGSSVNITNLTGSSIGITTGAGYSGQVATGTGLSISSPSISGTNKFTNYNGIVINTNSANGSNTSGTLTNSQLRISGTTVGAGSGGTVDNYGINLTQPAGSGGTTNNYGLYIQGAGAGSSNFSVYNASTADSYFAGNLLVGSTSNASNYKLQVVGSAGVGSLFTQIIDTQGAATLSLGYSSATSVVVGNATNTATISLHANTTLNLGTNTNNKTVNIGAVGTTNNTTAINLGSTTSAGGASTIQIGGTGVTSGSNTSTTVTAQAGQTKLAIANSGATVQTFTDSATAFTVQNASGNSVLSADTSTGVITLGKTSTLTGQLTFANSANAFTSTITGNTAATASYVTVLPDAVGVAGQCLTVAGVVSTTQTLGYTTCGGLGGANASLSNLTSVAINTSLLPGVTNSIDVGSASYAFQTGYFATSLLTSSLDTVTAGALNIGATNATSIVLGKSASNIATTVNGTLLVKPTSGNDSTTAFQVQNGAGTALLVADTTNGRVTIGTGGTAAGQLYVAGKAPTAVLSTVSVTTPQDVTVVGNYAYIPTSYNTNLRVIDVSNPAALASISTITTTAGPAVKVQVAGNYAYVTAGSTLVVYDISNPAIPVKMGTVTTASMGNDLVVKGRYAYVMSTANLDIIDISNPAAPVVVSTTVLTSATAIDVAGNYIYIATNTGVSIKNISNPASVTGAGSITVSGGVNRVSVEGRYAYLTHNSSYALGIYDISDPTAVITSAVGSVAIANAISDRPIIQGHYVYLSHSSSISIIDVSVASSPTIVSTTTAAGGNINAIDVRGRYLYVAHFGSVVSYDLGGAYIQQLETGGLAAGSIEVSGDAEVGGNINVQGSIVATGANIQGSTSIAGTVAIKSATNSSAAFQIQNADGTPLFAIDTSAASANMLSNPNFTTDTTGWATWGAGSGLARSTAQTNTGIASGQVTATTSNSGIKSLVTMQSFNGYTFSFALRASTAGATVVAGWNNGGAGSDNFCTVLPASTSPQTTGWTQYKCIISTGTVSAGSYIFVGTSGVAQAPLYIEAVTLNTTASTYSVGGIALRGAITTPVILQNTSDSTHAFQIQNSAGTSNLLVADTLNNTITFRDTLQISNNGLDAANVNNGLLAIGKTSATTDISIGSAPVNQNIMIGSALAGGINTITIGQNYGAHNVTIYGGTGSNAVGVEVGSGGTIKLGANATNKTIIIGATGTTNNTTAINIGNTTSTGGASTVQLGGTGALNGSNASSSVTLQGGQTGLSVANAGVTLNSFGNSSTAFKVQNASTVSVFNIDTSTSTITIGNGGNAATFSSTGELTLSGNARHTKTIIVTPEYSGAVLDVTNDTGGTVNCSTNYNGSMTSGIDLTNRMNYYNWTSAETGGQCYDIVAQIPIPSDWDAWQSTTPFSVKLHTSSTTNGQYAMEVRNSSGSAESSTASWGTIASLGSASTWTNVSPTTLSSTTTGYTAGDYLTLRIRLSAKSNANVRAGNITLNYYAKY